MTTQPESTRYDYVTPVCPVCGGLPHALVVKVPVVSARLICAARHEWDSELVRTAGPPQW